jgi:hypothetical protein
VATKVPFPYISGSLDDRSRFELERNFQYLTDQFVATVTGWDAIVDPTLSADSTVNLQFKTVFAAIKYLADTKGITNMTIGMRNTSTTATEIGTYGGTTSGLTVRVIAIGDMPPSFFAGSTSPAVPVWDLAGFDTNSKFTRLFLAGIRIAKKEGAVVPNATFLTVGTVGAMNCYFDGQGASSTTVTSNLTGGGTFVNCQFTDVAFNGDTAMIGCLVQYNRPTGTVVNAGQMVWLDTMCTGVSNSFTFQCTATGTIIVDGPSQMTNVSSPVATWQITAAKDIHIRQTVTIGIGREPILSITSPNILQCVIEGVFDELTVPAPKAASAAVAHRIAATAKNRADITGPANIALAVHDGSALTTYGLRLRGSGINGNVSVWLADSAAVATALDFIGALRCSINASITRVGAASTGHKQYAFDAASANNILILEADALGTASTDAGASDLVITDATFGSSPTTTTILADFSQAFMMGTL